MRVNIVCKTISNLKDTFKCRFTYFKDIALLAQYVATPFIEITIEQFTTCVRQHFEKDNAVSEMKVIILQIHLTLESKRQMQNLSCVHSVDINI